VQWEKIKDFLPGRKEHVAALQPITPICEWRAVGTAQRSTMARPSGAVRQVQSVHKRFVRWANSGVWERVFHELVRDKKNQYLMLDSPSFGLTSKRPRAAKKGLRQGFGRSEEV